MNDAIHLKYLMVSPEDLLWGLAVNSVGFQEVVAGKEVVLVKNPVLQAFGKTRLLQPGESQTLEIKK